MSTAVLADFTPSLPVAESALEIEVVTDLQAAEPTWRELVRNGALCTRYQHYAWMSAWHEHIGRRSGIEPFIVIGRDALGRAALLWPLGRRRVGPVSVARFMGGKHANFNLAIWRRDLVRAGAHATVRSVLDGIRQSPVSADLLILLNQPFEWEGQPNPLAVLRHQPSPSLAFRGALSEDFEALLRSRLGQETRKKLRQKERILAKHGTVSCRRAQSPDQIEAVLAAFFAQKAERMQELGLTNVFDEPGVRDFIEAAATHIDPDTGTPAIELYAAYVELYAAYVGHSIVATFGGICSAGRFSGMFNSMTSGPLRGESPGELLLTNVVRMACERGLATFDLGVGEAGYKKSFCNEAQPLFDAIVSVGMAGAAAAAVFRSQLYAKRAVKASPFLSKALQQVRRVRAPGG